MLNLCTTCRVCAALLESVYTQKLRHQQYSLSFVVASLHCPSQAHVVCSHMRPFLRTRSMKYSSLIVIIIEMSLIFLEGEKFATAVVASCQTIISR